VALLLGLSSITVPWNTLLLSVVLYIVLPVIVAQLWRRMLLAKGGQGTLATSRRGLAYLLNRRLGVAWSVAGPSALIGASSFFELAVATAVALFGFQSGAALSTVVGVLVEVPVMLSVVQLVRRSRGWYERAAPPRAHN
jgi:ACR3 family arsenite transporter